MTLFDGYYRESFHHMLRHCEMYLQMDTTLTVAMQQVGVYKSIYIDILGIDLAAKRLNYQQYTASLKGIKAAIGWLEDLATVRFSRYVTC